MFIILVSNVDNMKSDSNIWIENGISRRKTYFEICTIYENLGQRACKALAGFHAITGCNYNPSFNRKGNKGL